MATTVINKTVRTNCSNLNDLKSHKIQLFEQSDQHLFSPNNVNT